MTIKFPKQPSDPYYFQCCGVGHIHINSWLNKKPKYRDQKGTYYFTHDEKQILFDQLKQEMTRDFPKNQD